MTWTPRTSIGSGRGADDRRGSRCAAAVRDRAARCRLARRELHAGPDRQHGDESHGKDGSSAPAPALARVDPPSAEALVRVQRTVEHGHRAGTLSDPRRRLSGAVRTYDRPVVLSDGAIRRLIDAGRIGIDPFDPELMQPSSLDVRADRLLPGVPQLALPVHRRYARAGGSDRARGGRPTSEPFILHPGEFVLGSTLERVTLPDDLVARLEGKSSLGRLGLLIHSTAGFIDPGWDGHVTLELSNVANLPITIYPGDEDRPALVRAALGAGRAAVRLGGHRLQVPGPARPHARAATTRTSKPESNDGRSTVLVTGANGFVGRHVVRALVPEAGTVRAMVRERQGRGAHSRESSATSSAAMSRTRRACGRPSRAATRVVHLVAIIAGGPATSNA